MENDFLDGIYWEEWYNKGNVPMEPIDGTDVKYIPCDKDRVGIKGPCPISPRDRMIMYSNRMLGVPRMRQIRVTNQSCLIPEDFKEAIKVTRYLLICSSDGFTNLVFTNPEFAAAGSRDQTTRPCCGLSESPFFCQI